MVASPVMVGSDMVSPRSLDVVAAIVGSRVTFLNDDGCDVASYGASDLAIAPTLLLNLIKKKKREFNSALEVLSKIYIVY